jgi:hypothetical protein
MRRVTALPLVCRERQVPPRRLTVHRRFDPRSRAGATSWLVFPANFGISIRAPVRGSDMSANAGARFRLFRSALPCGERRSIDNLQQFSVDLNQDGLPGLGEDLRH